MKCGVLNKQPLFKVKLKKTIRGTKTLQSSKRIGKPSLSKAKKRLNNVNVFSVMTEDLDSIAPNLDIIQMIDIAKNRTQDTNDLLYYWNYALPFGLDPLLVPFNDIPIALKNPIEICQNRNLNPFMAFRSYYSQYAQGLKQIELSEVLAKAWHSDTKEQNYWISLTQKCANGL
ncbi:hypothetical protein KAFR_0D00710 [Kazachstania africana CBS 2517]|uniref:Alpha box domain-containing protein n=1 Tax=Kazachstania africana (strain ATCC 22294 / BCRC 22015 / CBS 2517 / CECT 1963 / NBRC 1671 / NRRL Y-8276) TaxID=1071382 RepID=H2ATL8_KAZAF|nr:hypothetical protein KAFR_0D00710 [Kazachstania africana CBS 2517]CCF57718.1 hypothetical protein KAFR_0D00710 [Kazachstania africana CBS 2517]